MRPWRISLWKTKSTISSWDGPLHHSNTIASWLLTRTSVWVVSYQSCKLRGIYRGGELLEYPQRSCKLRGIYRSGELSEYPWRSCKLRGIYWGGELSEYPWKSCKLRGIYRGGELSEYPWRSCRGGLLTIHRGSELSEYPWRSCKWRALNHPAMGAANNSYIHVVCTLSR